MDLTDLFIVSALIIAGASGLIAVLRSKSCNRY